MKSDLREQLLRDAIDFCQQEEILSYLRKTRGKCEYAEPFEWETGAGREQCWKTPSDPQEEWCARCRRLMVNRAAWRVAKRIKANARKRMISAYGRMKREK